MSHTPGRLVNRRAVNPRANILTGKRNGVHLSDTKLSPITLTNWVDTAILQWIPAWRGRLALGCSMASTLEASMMSAAQLLQSYSPQLQATPKSQVMCTGRLSDAAH